MCELRTLLRAIRVKMFFNEYYFGNSGWVTAMRIFGGPVLVLMGINLFQSSDRLGIGYGGFCVFYGVYLILKPILWIVFRLDSFKTIKLSIEVSADRLKCTDEFSESEILFTGFSKIMKRKYYYVLQLTKSSKVYLPFDLLSAEQKSILDTNLK